MASKPKNYAKTNNNPKTDKYVQVREHPSGLPEVRRDLRPQGRQEQQKGLLSLNQTICHRGQPEFQSSIYSIIYL